MQLKKLRANVIKGEGLWTEFELFDFYITCVMLLLVDLSRADTVCWEVASHADILLACHVSKLVN